MKLRKTLVVAVAALTFLLATVPASADVVSPKILLYTIGGVALAGLVVVVVAVVSILLLVRLVRSRARSAAQQGPTAPPAAGAGPS